MKYVEGSELHGWFKPQYGLMAGTWVANAHAALRVTKTDLAPPTPVADRCIDTWFAEASEPLIDAPRRLKNGRCVLKSANHAWSFADFYIDLVLAAYPTAHFALTGDKALAFVDDEPVALIMRRSESAMDAEYAEPIEDRPTCRACDGRGGQVCARCDGDGHTRSYCGECGSSKSVACRECDGRTWSKPCDTCAGTGKWTPEHDAARGAA